MEKKEKKERKSNASSSTANMPATVRVSIEEASEICCWPNERQTIPLSMEADSENVTPKHCFVRKHCLHIFPASSEFVGRKNPKGNPIVLHQIGIGCPYCLVKIDRNDIREAVLFPNEISQLYNASLCLLQRHFPCSHMPEDLQHKYLELKNDKRRKNISKTYWIESATKLGLVDTGSGILYRPDLVSSKVPSMSSTADTDKAATSAATDASQQQQQHLLEDENTEHVILDKSNFTEDNEFSLDYGYSFLETAHQRYFSHTDNVGQHQLLVLNFPGVVCKQCHEEFDGKLFSSEFESFFNYLLCASSEKKREYATMKMNNKKDKKNLTLVEKFYAGVWKTLHADCCANKKK